MIYNTMDMILVILMYKQTEQKKENTEGYKNEKRKENKQKIGISFQIRLQLVLLCPQSYK